ncbi:MAG: flavoprotein [Bacillota bacterium]
MNQISEELIRKIIKKVIAALEADNKIKITAIFTGGKIKFEEALSQLKKIDKKYNIVWNFIFSESAKEIHNHNKIRCEFEQQINQKPIQFNTVKENDLLLIPVLTRNTAAKLSAHFLDTCLLDYIFRSLMSSVPVIAASDAADLNGTGWQKLGFNNYSDAIKLENQRHLEKIKSYGIQLTAADNLAEKSFSILNDDNKKIINTMDSQNIISSSDKSNTKSIHLDSKIITYKDINPLANNIDKIYLNSNAIITPYAREVAERKGMIICLQQK